MHLLPRTVRQAAVRLPLAALVLAVASGCASSTAGAGSSTTATAAVHPAAVPSHGSPATSSWTTYDQNGLRTGVDASGASFSPPTTAWTSRALDGSLFGQPLIYANRVYAATENDTVYALAADSGAVLWSKHLATPFSPSTVPHICGDIDPTVGITGTPVIDTARDEIFVVATEQVPGGASHHLIGLDLYTGAVVLDEDIDPASVVAPAFELQRVSLALTDGRVVIGMGGNSGDCGTYHGLVISAPEDGSAPSTYVVADLPGDNQGAVWMGGSAPDVDTQGDVWVSTGNAATGSTPDASDSVLKLSPTMHLLDSFTPTTWKSDNDSDQDLASTAPVLLPDGTVFQVGKLRTAYLLNGAHLGGIGGQEAETADFCGNDPDGGAAQVDGTVYVPCSDGLRAVTPAPDTAPVATWKTDTGAHSSPIYAGGMVWSMGASTLYALNPANGDQEYSFTLTDPANHFPSPAAADGLVVAPGSDQLFAFDGPAGLPGPPTPAPTQPGYWLTASDGGIFSFGASVFYGSTGAVHLNDPIVGMAATPSRQGYWLVASDGGVFAFGDAIFHGSTGALHLNAPIVGIAPTPDGHGYWLAASDGGVFAFGDAAFEGSMGGTRLNAPVVGIAAGPDDRGYRLVASDGGVFAFGSATFHGSAGNLVLARPIVGMAAAPDTSGNGYWLVASDGGIFNYGGAGFYGSTGDEALGSPVVGMAPTVDGRGYWFASSDGSVYAEGDAVFSGAVDGLPLNAPVVGLAAGPAPA
jgi:hypothetical protein